MDHVEQLGPTIENIAWHKAGIMKPRTPAFSADQEPAVMSVLQTVAAEKGVTLEFLNVDRSPLPLEAKNIEVPVQRANCSLALEIVKSFLAARNSKDHGNLSESDILGGIERFNWPGRFEILQEGKDTWYLDGAHNNLSVREAARWFAGSTIGKRPEAHARIAMFSHFSYQRDGGELIETLVRALVEEDIKPQYVILTTYQENQDGSERIDHHLKIPDVLYQDILAGYADLWKAADPEAIVQSTGSIEEAIDLARRISQNHGGMEILVTGSLHLVGGALYLLQNQD